jgi:hypothetical protein
VTQIIGGQGAARLTIRHRTKFKMVDKNPAVERLMKHFGLYKRENAQKTDPITALMDEIATAKGARASDLVKPQA